METEQLLIFLAKIISSLVLGGSLVLFFAHLSKFLLLHPRRLRSKLQSQGIKGPSSTSFLYGNLPHINKIQLQNQKQPTPEETKNQELEDNSPLQHTWPSRVFSHIKLLQLILDAARSYEESGGDQLPADVSAETFIVDNCKSIYFAGYENTALTASWCLMLLAAYPEWQARARAEVLDVCGSELDP